MRIVTLVENTIDKCQMDGKDPDMNNAAFNIEGTDSSMEPCADQYSLMAEHGLSFYIEFEGGKYLLDAGQSDLFLHNAFLLGVDLEKVGAAFLSHAHYDHADGMPYFMKKNQTARLYLQQSCKEDCYSEVGGLHYIGIKRGFLSEYRDRIVRVQGPLEIIRHVWLIPHSTAGLATIGAQNGLLRMLDGAMSRDCGTHEIALEAYASDKTNAVTDNDWEMKENMAPDDFTHEQSLVFETKKGLVIMNSCSHGRVDNILREVRACFPESGIHAFIGGFHISKWPENDVREYLMKLKQEKVDLFYTGHCTGSAAFFIMQELFGERARELHTGMIFDL